MKKLAYFLVSAFILVSLISCEEEAIQPEPEVRALEVPKDSIPENTPPTVSNSIEDLSLFEKFNLMEIDLSDVFTDTDGDELVYSATSNNEDLIIAFASDTELVIGEVSGIGSVEITVIADDGNEGTVSLSFNVDVKLLLSLRILGDWEFMDGSVLSFSSDSVSYEPLGIKDVYTINNEEMTVSCLSLWSWDVPVSLNEEMDELTFYLTAPETWVRP